jgi:hypothetical protein
MSPPQGGRKSAIFERMNMAKRLFTEPIVVLHCLNPHGIAPLLWILKKAVEDEANGSTEFVVSVTHPWHLQTTELSGMPADMLVLLPPHPMGALPAEDRQMLGRILHRLQYLNHVGGQQNALVLKCGEVRVAAFDRVLTWTPPINQEVIFD